MPSQPPAGGDRQGLSEAVRKRLRWIATGLNAENAAFLRNLADQSGEPAAALSHQEAREIVPLIRKANAGIAKTLTEPTDRIADRLAAYAGGKTDGADSARGGEAERPEIKTFKDLLDKYGPTDRERELEARIEELVASCPHTDMTQTGDGNMRCDRCGFTEPDPFDYRNTTPQPVVEEQPTGECRVAMSGPTCMNPDCPPCQTPEMEPVVDPPAEEKR